MFSIFKKKPEKNSALSEFMRNASAREQKRVFKKVIEGSIKAQQATIDRADRILAEREAEKSRNAPLPEVAERHRKTG